MWVGLNVVLFPQNVPVTLAGKTQGYIRAGLRLDLCIVNLYAAGGS